jgi:hypothetical protein
MSLTLQRTSNTGNTSDMAVVTAGWTSGSSSGYDNTISNPIIDNNNYSYQLKLVLNPNDNVNDCQFYKGKIEFTG